MAPRLAERRSENAEPGTDSRYGGGGCKDERQQCTIQKSSRSIGPSTESQRVLSKLDLCLLCFHQDILSAHPMLFDPLVLLTPSSTHSVLPPVGIDHIQGVALGGARGQIAGLRLVEPPAAAVVDEGRDVQDVVFVGLARPEGHGLGWVGWLVGWLVGCVCSGTGVLIVIASV